jgi:hypothetical protein
MPARSHAHHKVRSDDPPAKVLGTYRGQWVAFYHRKVVAAGPDGGKVVDEARAKLGGKEPTLMRVPEHALYLL